MPQNYSISIVDMTQKAYDVIKQSGRSDWTCQGYWYRGVVPIRNYYKQLETEGYSPENIHACVSWFQKQFELGSIDPVKFRRVRKIAEIMDALYAGKPYNWKNLAHWNTTILPAAYSVYLEDYIGLRQENGCKESTLRGEKPIIKHFLLNIWNLGCEDIMKLTLKTTMEYIQVLSKDYRRVDAALSVLRKFGTFLYDRGLTDIHLGRAFSIKVPAYKKIHTGFTNEEAGRIVSGIDRSTKCGKRDYAILMLAMHTGLRGVDVLTLRFESINWKRKELHLVQNKTAQELTLPVPVSVLNAVADYILNARPESEEKSVIFLRDRYPHTLLKTWGAHAIVKRNAARAGVGWTASEQKGFHSFRRGIANWMLEAGVPLEMITEVLGQTSSDSTKPYIAVNQSGLCECALSLQPIPLRREELG